YTESPSVPYGRAWAERVVIHDDRGKSKPPRWWAPVPPTPPEAPLAKRRSRARSQRAIALFVGGGVVFIAFTLFLLFRIGRQVATEPSVSAQRVSTPVATAATASAITEPPEPAQGSGGFAGTHPSTSKGAGGAPAHRTREVFRKPSFSATFRRSFQLSSLPAG